MSFFDFDIDSRCLPILKRQDIVTPTPIQERAIPPALTGQDVLAIAETGTGKTLAFGLPALTRLAAAKPGRNRMLVLTPTRELAQQVHKALEAFATKLRLRSMVIVGGVSMRPQVNALRKGQDIIVATPGRLLDHMNQGNIRFNQLSILILDEGDRMLDMGFLPDIKRIVAKLPEERQTMLFSATFPAEIERITKAFQRNVHRIQLAKRVAPAESVNQHVHPVDAGAKTELLGAFLKQPEVTSAIVFIRTKHRTDRIAKQLRKLGVDAQPIHSGRSQAQRERALDGFRRGKFNVLVATDVAARGIDVQGVTHVVNFDVPRTFDDYVHRIGRTGRADLTGDAHTFVTPQEARELGAIEKGLGKRLPRLRWDGSGFVAIPVEKHSAMAGNNAPKGKPARGRRAWRRTRGAQRKSA